LEHLFKQGNLDVHREVISKCTFLGRKTIPVFREFLLCFYCKSTKFQWDCSSKRLGNIV